MPRDPQLIAFGASLDRFADNSAYLYLHMSRHTGFGCVWISGSRQVVNRLHSEGLQARYRYSPGGLYSALRAGWYVYSSYPSDINGWLYDGTRLMNLWHGVGMKKIERDMQDPLARRLRSSSPRGFAARAFADERKRPDWILSTGPFMSAHFASAFDVPLNRCLELGYPRNDHLTSEGTPPRTLVQDPQAHEKLANAQLVVGYFPTWRDDGSSPHAGGAMLLSRMASLVASQGGLLVYKPHINDNPPSVLDPGIVLLNPAADVNAYLHLCDVVITDYSAVGYDFLLLNRPIIYFCPDFAKYQDLRGMHCDPLSAMPGPVCYSWQELERVLARLGTLVPAGDAGRVKDQFWAQPPGGAASRVAGFISSVSEAARAGDPG